MKLLVVGDIGIVFTYEYILHVASKLPDVHVDVLNFSPRTPKHVEREKELSRIGCAIFYQPKYARLRSHKFLHPLMRLGEAIRYRICKSYDVVHLHYLGVDSWIIPRYTKKGKRVIASIYGSDLLRAGKTMQSVLIKVFARADTITVASRYVQNALSERFQKAFDSKVALVRYGSEAAAYMHQNLDKYAREDCKRGNGLPLDKTIVLCGYNGSPAQRHLEMIRQFKALPAAYKNRLYLLFQCSYGSSEGHLRAIGKELDTCGIDGRIVTQYMRGEDLAKFRNSVDVFLNLQPTDVLSATMIEELEAGAIVVKGDWLAYPDLDERGIYMLSIRQMEELPQIIQYILDNADACRAKAKNNRGIWKILSWQEEYPKWESVIVGQCDHQESGNRKK